LQDLSVFRVYHPLQALLQRESKCIRACVCECVVCVSICVCARVYECMSMRTWSHMQVLELKGTKLELKGTK